MNEAAKNPCAKFLSCSSTRGELPSRVGYALVLLAVAEKDISNTAGLPTSRLSGDDSRCQDPGGTYPSRCAIVARTSLHFQSAYS